MAAEQPSTRDVRFLFEGLFFFFFNEDWTEGSTGLLSVDPRHSLKIRIKRGSGEQEFTLPLKTIRNLPKDISITKTSPTSATAPVEILGGWERPESAQKPREIAEGMYAFGYIADFEGIDFHGSEFPTPILKRPGRLHPILRFNAGTFYTAKPSDDKIKVKREGEGEIVLGPLAEITGVKICLAREDHLSCTIGSQTFSLDDVSVVRLEHICATCPEGEDDMQLYYEVLDIPTSMRFTFYEPLKVRPAICFGAGGSKTFGMP